MRRHMAAGVAISMCLVLSGASVLAQSAEAGATEEWPFIRTSCPEADTAPLLLVALGTSETAGWGIRADESYSPQEAYPARYADLLCDELARPVELHSYFPDQLGNELAPLAWWTERLQGDETMRRDLSAADVVVVWTLSAHDVVVPLLFGGCRGEWPDPLEACLEAATAHIEPQSDEAFATIGELVPDSAAVLALDGYVIPFILDRWGTKPYFEEIRQLIDPHFVVERLAPEYGFSFVATEAVFNGADVIEPPADGLFQADGLHPTAAGAQLTAETIAQQDGLGD